MDDDELDWPGIGGGAVVPLAGGAPEDVDLGGTPGPVVWPRFVPFSVGDYSFVTFSSTRDHGHPVGTALQVWMVALQQPGARSFAPFWLPWQDPQVASYNGVWVQAR